MIDSRFNIWRILSLILIPFLVILIPVYWYHYGPQNFLWLSDIGLFLTAAALWTGQPLFMSVAALGILPLELTWCVDFLVDLFTNINLITLSDYMFDSSYPLYLRSISLFHLALPIVWISYLWQFGYEKKAIWYMLGLFWVILGLTYCCTPVSENINWVFLPFALKQASFTEVTWLWSLAIGFPLVVLFPMHCLYQRIFKVIK